MTATGELLDRAPPQSIEAERAVLGSILLMPDVLDDVLPILRANDFYQSEAATVYARMLAMHTANRRLDVMLLVEALRKADELEQVGGEPYIGELMEASPTAAHAVHYAEIVRDHATQRALIRAGSRILQVGYDTGLESRDALNAAEEEVFSIRDSQRTGAENSQAVGDVLQDVLSSLDARKQGIGVGLTTGFPDLDDLIRLRPGEVIILAARPSMGKTALALNIVSDLVFDRQQPVLFVSLEMSRMTIGDRLLASRARLDLNRMATGNIGPNERSDLVEQVAAMSLAPLWIDDSFRMTVGEIAAAARRIKRKHGLALLVVDYVQLIEADDNRTPRQEQVALISKRLKGIARELSIPALCLAQLNRQSEQGGSNKPKLSHLRESGAIEQDADVVMFIHREEYFCDDPVEKAKVAGKAEILVRKNRNGPTGDIPLTWFKTFTKFESAARPVHEASSREPQFDAYNQQQF